MKNRRVWGLSRSWSRLKRDIDMPERKSCKSHLRRPVLTLIVPHREVVEVPIDSPDAKKWPLWSSPEETQTTVSSEPPPSEAPGSSKPAHKRPGPRKSKVSLPSLPTPSQKAKKISTLDKSAMDWRAHVQGSESGLKDELEANRRSGGYIEKVEFLNRVEERKASMLEAGKSGKRRRP